MKDLRKYLCPFCEAHLNPREYIVLRGELNGRHALVFLSPAPGDYDAIVPDDFPIKPSDELLFTCPVCGHDLTSQRDPTMAELRFRGEDEAGAVVFSRVSDHHATYFISDGIVHSFGEHADADGVNFWGVRPGG